MDNGMVVGRLGSRLACALAAVLVASAGASAASASSHAQAVSLSPLEQGVLADINALRAQHHLTRLRLSPALSASAHAHTQQMAQDGYFAHESADGSPFWQRIKAYYGPLKSGYWSVGENLLYASPDIDAAGALKLWLKSPGHRANMLNPIWREIGVAAVHEAQAPGVYDGLDVTIVTTDFGVRR